MPGYEYGATHSPAERTSSTPPRRIISDPEAGMLSLYCTRCEAAPGRWCVTPKGQRTTMHHARFDAWRRGDAPSPYPRVVLLQDHEAAVLVDLTAASSRLRRARDAHQKSAEELSTAQGIYDDAQARHAIARDARVAAENEPDEEQSA